MMGYFCNGTEGEIYFNKYCDKCLNCRDLDDGRGVGCPVWDAHHLFDMDGDSGDVLDFFIPREDPRHVFNQQCKMFLRVRDIK